MITPLRRLRRARALTVSDLAIALDVSPSLVSMWERGELLPPPPRLQGLARVLELDANTLGDQLRRARASRRRDLLAGTGRSR